jgi:hypothetical protein
MLKSLKNLLLILGSVFFALSCQFTSVKPSIEYRGLKSVGADRQEQILKELRALQVASNSYRALARVTLERGREKHKITQAILLERPETLRIEVFTSELNQLQLMLKATEGRLHVHNFSTGKEYSTDLSRETIKKELHLPFDFEDLLSWFFGSVNTNDLLGLEAYMGEAYEVVSLQKEGNRRIVFKLGNHEGCLKACISEFELFEDEELILFSKFTYSKSDVPTAIEFRLFGDGVLGRIKILESEVLR